LDTSEAKASLALVNFLFESLGNDKAKEVQDQVRDTIFSKMIKEFLDDTTDESSKE